MQARQLLLFDGAIVGDQTLVTAPFPVSDLHSLVADLFIRSAITEDVVTVAVEAQHANRLNGDDWETLASFQQAGLTSGESYHETVVADFSSDATMAFIRFQIATSDVASSSIVDLRITAVGRTRF